MKYLSLMLIALFVSSSCCATNHIKEDIPKEIIQLEPPKTLESPKVAQVIETVVETPKVEEVVENVVVEETPPESILEKPQEVFNHSAWNDLLQKYVSPLGTVNYKGFKTDEIKLDTYLDLLSKNKPSTSASKDEKLAFWINAYNAFTIKLILNNYPLKSIKDINKPWDKEFITLGTEQISLGHIEHEILRKMSEPRIHFAIVCASISCPKLQNTAFESSTIEVQLTTSAKEFLADTNRNSITQNKIKISKIFSWFSKDFKQNGALIDFLNKYSEIAISQNAKKSYKDYNWSLNE